MDIIEIFTIFAVLVGAALTLQIVGSISRQITLSSGQSTTVFDSIARKLKGD